MIALLLVTLLATRGESREARCAGIDIVGDPHEVEQIVNCRTGETILEFDAIESARAERRGKTVHVVQTGKWPFGPHWKWIDVPMFEWTIDDNTRPDPRPHVLMPKPKATPAEIRKMIRDYRNRRGDAEEFVGRMFAAAVSGDAEARRLFLAMHHDRHLDGGAGEIWSYAKADLELLRRP